MIRWITCRDFTDFMDDYLEGRLQGTALAEFNNHLAGCPPCVAYMHSYRTSMALAKEALGAPEDPVPGDVPEGLVKAILGARGKGRP